MASSKQQTLATCALGLLMFALACNAQLQLSDEYYAKSCPNVTSIIRDLVKQQVAEDVGVAAGLLRLHFHDCFVNSHCDIAGYVLRLIKANTVVLNARQVLFIYGSTPRVGGKLIMKPEAYRNGLEELSLGCDASVLLDPVSSLLEVEKDSPPNANSLRAFDQVDDIKAALEKECPGIVSCADILAIAARDAVEETGGPTWPVPLGRRDGYISSSEEAQKKLPPSDGNFADLTRNFANVGLDALDMVILSGAHTLGRGRCVKVWDRLYNFTGVPDLTDPSLDPAFADDLKVKCPKDNTGTHIMMDTTDGKFDNVYYQDVTANRGMFQSDATLITNPIGTNLVATATTNQTAFFEQFAVSMLKMGKIDLKLGTQGEVRRQCRVCNPSRHPRRSSTS